MSTSGGAGGGAVAVHTVDLDGVAILSMFTAPTVLIPAPGANKIVQLIGATIEAKPGVCGYNMTNAGIYVRDAADSSNEVNNAISGFDWLSGFVPTANITTASGPVAQNIATVTAANAPLVVACTAPGVTRYGAIVTAGTAVGGTGYVIGDTGTIGAPQYGATATYVITSVAAITGAVTGFTVVDVGVGYDTASNPVVTAVGGGQPGIGTGFTVNITAIPPADGHLYVTATYVIVTTH